MGGIDYEAGKGTRTSLIPLLSESGGTGVEKKGGGCLDIES